MNRVRLLAIVLVVGLLLPGAMVSAQGGGYCTSIIGVLDNIAAIQDECLTNPTECSEAGIDASNFGLLLEVCGADPTCAVCTTAMTACVEALGGDTLLFDVLACIDTGFICMGNYFGCDLGGEIVGGASCGFADARVDQLHCAAPVAMFCRSKAILVYTIGEDGGSYLMSVSLHGDAPTENRLLAEKDGVSVYQLTSGEFQLNTTDADGSPYTIVWDDCPVSTVYQIK